MGRHREWGSWGCGGNKLDGTSEGCLSDDKFSGLVILFFWSCGGNNQKHCVHRGARDQRVRTTDVMKLKSVAVEDATAW